jgi:phosphatidate cytidylyltransferase
MLRTRLLVGGALIALLALVVFLDERLGRPYCASVLLLAFTVAGQDELLRMMRGRRPGCWIIMQAAAIATMTLVACADVFAWRVARAEIVLDGVVLGLMGVLAQKVFAFERATRADVQDHARDVAAAALSLAYVLAPMAMLQSLMYMAPPGWGPRTAGAVVLISKCGDIGGYLAGTFMGKRRILPRVSPKKSYEGSLGGLALTIAAVLLLAPYFPWLTHSVSNAGLIVFAVAINLATQAGDFAESMLKRTCGVKDSAALLPTFGGALDIIDSLVFAVPVAHVMFRLAGLS